MSMQRHTLQLRQALFLTCASGVLAESAEDIVTPVAAAVAGTLLGAITFMMSMFYCLNHSDEDMRKYTYEAMSGTISIFCAVLIFSTLNDLLDEYLLEKTSLEFQAGAAMLHMLFWFTMLQVALGFKSGAVGESRDKCESAELSRKELSKIKLSLKSYSIMLSHITGFASINAWGSLQQLPYYHAHPWQPFAVVVVSALCQFLLQRMCDTIREKYCFFMDGSEDEREKLWIEETADAEIDVIGLTLSFNTCQALRFAISGVFPDQEGREQWDVLISHPWNEVWGLVSVGFSDLLVMLAVCYVKHHYGKQIYKWLDVEEERSIVALILNCIITTLTMINAWTFFYGGQWFFAGMNAISRDSMLLSVIVTMMTSFASFVSIWLLDKAADSASRNEREEMEYGFRSTISSFSFLIGFGWEQCFDRAVSAISKCFAYQFPHFPNLYSLAKVALVGFVVCLVAPAWKTFILPMVIREGWKTGVVINEDNASGVLMRISEHFHEHDEDCRATSGDGIDLQHDDMVMVRKCVKRLHALLGVEHLDSDSEDGGGDGARTNKDCHSLLQVGGRFVDAVAEAQKESKRESASSLAAPRRSSAARDRMSTNSTTYALRTSVQDRQSAIFFDARDLEGAPRFPTFDALDLEGRSNKSVAETRSVSTETNGNASNLPREREAECMRDAIAELKHSSQAFLEKQNRLASENVELKMSLDRLKQELQSYHKGELDRIKGVREFSSQMGNVLDTISLLETQIRETSPDRYTAKNSASCTNIGVCGAREPAHSQTNRSLEERFHALRAPVSTGYNSGLLHQLQAPLLTNSTWSRYEVGVPMG